MNRSRSLGLSMMLSMLGVSGCTWLRPDRAARVATGTTAHDLCSETFISGLDPDQVFDESVAPRPGFEWVAPFVRYSIDRERGEVRASFAGGFASRAIYRGAQGCMLVTRPDAPGEPPPGGAGSPQALAAPAGLVHYASQPTPEALPSGPTPPAVQAAVEEAFAENVRGALRQTKAVLVLHRGRVIAERYAPGYGPTTPMPGFSISKSVTNALAGVLVHDGKLELDDPIPLEGEPGPTVTLEQALRMTTGLDLDETGTGFDPSNHMLYVHTDDMAAFARKARRLAPPDRRWSYSSGATHLVARQIRDALGGSGEAVQRFAHERLFGPLGMERAVLEADETGTPIGAHYTFATTRDWARLGQLFLDNGLAPNGERLLPENWVRWSTTNTLDTTYGAGWWINRRTPGATTGRAGMPVMPDAPPDTFYGLGNFGQWVIVVPSRELVIVRLGRAHTPYFDFDGINRLVASTVAALPGSAP